MRTVASTNPTLGRCSLASKLMAWFGQQTLRLPLVDQKGPKPCCIWCLQLYTATTAPAHSEKQQKPYCLLYSRAPGSWQSAFSSPYLVLRVQVSIQNKARPQRRVTLGFNFLSAFFANVHELRNNTDQSDGRRLGMSEKTSGGLLWLISTLQAYL